MILDITVNGIMRHLQARSGDRLVDVLRKELILESLLADCLAGTCGKCLIFMDGRLTHSCLVPAFKANGSSLVTFEMIAGSADVHDIETALDRTGSKPCPFCRVGKIMAIYDLLARNPLPPRDEILDQMAMVPCTCSDPHSMTEAVILAADTFSRRKFKRESK